MYSGLARNGIDSMNITSEKSNLPFFETNKQCIIESTDHGYWWGIVDKIEIFDSYLSLEVSCNQGPFRVKEGKPIYSNEQIPYIINARAFPDLPNIREMISRIISLIERLKNQNLDNHRYRTLYDDVINKLTRNGC